MLCNPVAVGSMDVRSLMQLLLVVVLRGPVALRSTPTTLLLSESHSGTDEPIALSSNLRSVEVGSEAVPRAMLLRCLAALLTTPEGVIRGSAHQHLVMAVAAAKLEF